MKTSAEVWADSASKRAINEIDAIFNEEVGDKGAEHMHQLRIYFLARYTGMVVYSVLKQKPAAGTTKEKMLDFVSGNFAAIKTSVQDAIAAAFQGAMTTFSGKDVEYYCQIKMVPEPKNKMVC